MVLIIIQISISEDSIQPDSHNRVGVAVLKPRLGKSNAPDHTLMLILPIYLLSDSIET